MKKLIKIFGIILLSTGAIFTLTACENQHKTDPLLVNNKAHHLSAYQQLRIENINLKSQKYVTVRQMKELIRLYNNVFETSFKKSITPNDDLDKSGKIMDIYQNSRVVDNNDGTVYRVKLFYSSFHKLTKDKLTPVFKDKKAEIDLNWQKDHDAKMQSNNNRKQFFY